MSEEKPIRNFILQEYLDGREKKDGYVRSRTATVRRLQERVKNLREHGVGIEDIAYVLGISVARVNNYLNENGNGTATKPEPNEVGEDGKKSILSEKPDPTLTTAINKPLTEERVRRLSEERASRIITSLNISSPEEIKEREGLTNSQFEEILLSRGIILENDLAKREPNPPRKSVPINIGAPKSSDGKSQKDDLNDDSNIKKINSEELKRRLTEQEERAREIRRAKELSKKPIHSEEELYATMKEIFGLKCPSIALNMAKSALRSRFLSPREKARLRKGLKKAEAIRTLYLEGQDKKGATKEGEAR